MTGDRTAPTFSRGQRVGLVLVLLILAAASAAVLSIPVFVGAGHNSRTTHVLLVRLDRTTTDGTTAADVERYVSSSPQHLVVVEPQPGEWPCAPVTSHHSAGNAARSSAVPEYCGPLSDLISRLAGPPIVLDGDPAGLPDRQAGSGPDVTAQQLLADIYGRGIKVTGGPIVYAGLLQVPAGFNGARAAAAVLTLAIVVAGLGAWRWDRQRSRAASQPSGHEADPVSGNAEPARRPRQRDGDPGPGRTRLRDRHLPVRSDKPAPAGQVPGHVTVLTSAVGLAETNTLSEPLRRADATTIMPPVLGGISRASRTPWGLPPLPSPSAIAADSVRVGGLSVRAASVVGPGHRVQQPAVPRQDAYRLAQDAAGRYLLVAIADGMSDSRYSDLGANVATTAIVSELREALAAGADAGQLVGRELYRAVASQMISVAEQRNLPAEAVRAVVLTAVIPISPDRAGRRRAWLAGIGDVSAWRRQPGNWQHIAGHEKAGLDANTLSAFLPYHPGQADEAMVDIGPHDVLALTTDGVADAFTVIEGGAAWFADRWQEPPPIASFILDVCYEAKTHLDDRTAVVIWFDAKAGAGIS